MRKDVSGVNANNKDADQPAEINRLVRTFANFVMFYSSNRLCSDCLNGRKQK